MIYDYHNVPKDTEIWAYAYSVNTSKETNSLKCKPVLGKIINNKFYELKANGQLKNKSVYSYSRKYADTYAEATFEYNKCIDKCIKKLEDLIEAYQKEKI